MATIKIKSKQVSKNSGEKLILKIAEFCSETLPGQRSEEGSLVVSTRRNGLSELTAHVLAVLV
jgi:hypothetical protein